MPPIADEVRSYEMATAVFRMIHSTPLSGLSRERTYFDTEASEPARSRAVA
jgi:hypothetical protein